MADRPRVLVHTDAPGRGGAEASLGHLLAGVSTRWDVHLAATTPGVLDWLAAQRHGVPAHLVGRDVAGSWRLLTRLRPDIVHVNLQVPWGAAPMRLAALALATARPGTRLVAVEQLPLRTTAALALWRTRALALRLDAHVAVGAASARRTEDFYALGRGSVRSIPNCVPDLGPAAARPSDGSLVVGSVGRLDPVKGYDVLLRALREVPGVRLEVVGDGDARAGLAELADRLGVAERVAWAGWHEDARSRLACYDVFCLPSRSEGFPLALVEAMLAGVPAVATTVGSVAEALDDGRAGLLVPPDEPAALAGALGRLRDDAALRRSLGGAARARAVAHYTVAQMVTAYEELWTALLATPPAPRVVVPRPRA